MGSRVRDRRLGRNQIRIYVLIQGAHDSWISGGMMSFYVSRLSVFLNQFLSLAGDEIKGVFA